MQGEDKDLMTIYHLKKCPAIESDELVDCTCTLVAFPGNGISGFARKLFLALLHKQKTKA